MRVVEAGELLVRLLGIFTLAVLITCLTACPSETRNSGRSTDGGSQAGAEHRATTEAPEPEDDAEATPPDTPTWDYVALGDSLAAGVGAHRGYVARYAQHLQGDTGTRIRVINLGVSGQTSTQLLHAIRHDPAMQKALGRAEVVTLNIGLNDLGQATASYESGTCGGQQNEACLREAVARVEGNWDAIIQEILNLRSTEDTIIRSAGLGYTPRVGKVFEPYVSEVSRHIASAAAEGDIPYVEIHLPSEGMSEDGLHPNDKGYRLIADRLSELGYEPLDAR